MKKRDLKQLVVAGMVAGSLLATGAVHAVEGEIVAAGSHSCGAGKCGGQNRPTTADNYAPQQQTMQRPATQEEIRQQQLRNQQQNSQRALTQEEIRQQQMRNQQQHAQQQQQQNPNYQNQPAQSCNGKSSCSGR